MPDVTEGCGICPEGYLPRIVDAQVERYLRIFGAVEIAGTKWCGKTWTALRHGASVSYVDEALAAARDDPSTMLSGEQPHVIDEWQRVPAIWDTVRHEVDRTRGHRGAWILTGSSTPLPEDGSGGEPPSHSGAGRIGTIRMHPMSLFETGESSGAVSLRGLFDGDFAPTRCETTASTLLDLACRGGWPEAVDLQAEDAQVVARDYLRLACRESVPRHKKDGEIARRLILSLARNLGQATTYKTMLGDMFGEHGELGEPLSDRGLALYLDLLRRLYLIEEVRGWAPPARARKRIATRPKRYLADPSLAVAALGMSPASLLQDWQTFGLVFENLCVRDLTVYARAHELCSDEPLRYYRDDSGLEADAIVELADGRWAAFEFKTGESKLDQAVVSLRRLRAKLCEKEGRARMRPPEFMAVVIGVSNYAREVEKGIFAIPIQTLGA